MGHFRNPYLFVADVRCAVQEFYDYRAARGSGYLWCCGIYEW